MPSSILVVGAGLFGSVCARELTDAGHCCTVIDRRDHIGGNCYSEYDEKSACHRHVYGSHIFHTDKKDVWKYITRFTRFNHYVNRPKVRFGDCLYSFPINLMTLYQVYGVKSPSEAKARLAAECEIIPNPQNMEEWCLSKIGRKLYEIFIEGYTQKQWNRHPRELPADIIKRLPVRLTFDDNYFTHPFQGIPVGGYTAIFERMLKGIQVELGVDFLLGRDRYLADFDHVIYTGPIDEFFDYNEGILEYRSLLFENERLPVRDFQGNALINYTELSIPYTRIIEHKHFDMNFDQMETLITREYPANWRPGDTPYYPVNTVDNQKLYSFYAERAQVEYPSVTFGGRLGLYRYLDMDQVIAEAFVTSSKLKKELR
jgi:UDP-galactopyranose mutase